MVKPPNEADIINIKFDLNSTVVVDAAAVHYSRGSLTDAFLFVVAVVRRVVLNFFGTLFFAFDEFGKLMSCKVTRPLQLVVGRQDFSR